MSTTDDVLVGRYRLLQEIGAGGMGVVWRAYDERLGRDVAVKRLHPGASLGAADAQLASHRAMREARITARLHHPHAVPVFDVVEHQGQPCLVMQYFPSSSLAELVTDGRSLSPAQVARIGGEVASALAAAHDVGIVHRDVKPANVLVAPDGAAKISDFGISHAMGDVSLTSSGLVTGTPAYLAPEVARGEEATAASDVFSLGSTLYTVLEGHAPFGTSDNPMALLHRVASGEVEPPRRSGPLTPVLTSMLATRAQDRPTMAEVARRLGALGEAAEPGEAEVLLAVTAPDPGGAGGVDDGSGAVAVPEPAGEDPLWAFREPQRADEMPPGPDERGPRRRGALLTVLGLALVVAAVVIGLVSRQGDDPAASPTTSGTARPSASSGSATGSTASSSPRPPSSAAATTTPPRPSRTASSTPTPTPTPAAPAAPTASQLRAAVRDYYALLPGDRDAGWERLTERYQRTTARNRDYYDSFWGSVERVSVAELTATAPGSVTATVTYHYADGRTFVERTSYRLVRDDGDLKIDRSTVLSSVQR